MQQTRDRGVANRTAFTRSSMEIPEDVRAELDADGRRTLTAPTITATSRPPEDVLAELDAEARVAGEDQGHQEREGRLPPDAETRS